MFGLALLFVYVFLLSFRHFDRLPWGIGSWSLCLSCICLLAVRALVCVTVSLPPGVGGWLRFLFVALPWLFCLLFFYVNSNVHCIYMERQMEGVAIITVIPAHLLYD